MLKINEILMRGSFRKSGIYGRNMKNMVEDGLST